MTATNIRKANWTVQCLDVDVTAGAVENFHRGIAAFHCQITAQLLGVNPAIIGMKSEIGFCRNLYFVLDDAAVLVSAGEKMGDKFDATVTLVLLDLYFV
jgi:hypothetical protein